MDSKGTPDKLLKPYSAKETENRIYSLWEESGFFNPDVCVEKGVTKADAEPFSIVLPPPNVTGTLHTGHALMLVIEDIMVRFARMQGKRTLWLPGTDHAAIATQSKVEKLIEKEEGKRKQDLGRDEFLKRVEKFAQESHDTIINQCKKMGASLDWSREAFTLDEKRSFAVRTAFKRMYDEGLIYRGHRIVNWDPKGQTVISDDEIVHEERRAKMYTFKYSKDFPISISTTRPETKIGDTAVAVNPTDERYKQYIGKTYDEFFCGVPITIKIVADEVVEKNFGTGALGVTPAHSQIDAEIAQRHGLKTVQVINEYGKMELLGISGHPTPDVPIPEEEKQWTLKIAGKKTTEAREIVVEWLRAKGLLEKEEEITQNISTAERTGGIIEPLPKLQWFIDVNKPIPSKKGKSLKELMLLSVRSGEIKIMPSQFENVYYHWIENLRDWCISRQIWYGHQIPAFYDIAEPINGNGILILDKGGFEIPFDSNIPELLNKIKARYAPSIVTFNDGTGEKKFISLITFAHAKYLVEKLKFTTWKDLKQRAAHIETKWCESILVLNPKESVPESAIQDPDTLDTWFSSGLWTFSTLGWPEKTIDLETYHPTTVLETGYDILFFWIARMILMSQYLLGEVPFKTAYLHGLVRDEKGRKMSKSLGNIVDPLTIIDKYGTDALRMAMIVGVGPGNDSNVGEEKIKAYSKFANKLWNVARFVLENSSGQAQISLLDAEDKASFDELDLLLKEITVEMEEYKFYLVAEKLYHYVWHAFADIIIERSKKKIAEDAGADSARALLSLSLPLILKALHPFMPFITEELWSMLPAENGTMLMVEAWPCTA